MDDFTLEPELLVGNVPSSFGVYAHEFGHALGLPDLYDVNYASGGDGRWTVMAGGSWNGPTVSYGGYGYSSGSSPADFDAWSKSYLGWLMPQAITGDLSGASIPQVELGGTTVYRLNQSGTAGSDYFLVENRQRTSYDSYLPADGLLIWHVDPTIMSPSSQYWATFDTVNAKAGSTNAPNHYGLLLMEADGLFELYNIANNRGNGGDPFPGTSNRRAFNSSSTPNSNLWSGIGTVGVAGATLSSIAVTNISNSSSTMTADLKVLPSVPGRATLNRQAAAPDTSWQTDFTVTVFAAGTGGQASRTPLATASARSDSSGHFVSAGLAVQPGSYDVSVKGSHTLGNLKQNVTLPASAEIDFGTLREGDSIQDNLVDVSDLSILAAAFGKHSNEAGYDARADLNQDGVVDASDVAALSSDFARAGDQTLP